jgi:hypothetical protein
MRLGAFVLALLGCVVRSEIPCTYVGHLVSDANWYGFLANVTIVNAGRMTFEFAYPVDDCCQNILFYTEAQLAEISPRMTCWQKEYPLLPNEDEPEDDHVLRLSPRFTWSGCHVTHRANIPYFECVGGRSLIASSNVDFPQTWYFAVSACHSISGLNLEYKMQVYGHIGDCRPGYRVLSTTPSSQVNDEPRVAEKNPAATSGEDAAKTCIIEGYLNTSVHWFGFIANMTFLEEGSFTYFFDFPTVYSKIEIVLYSEEDLEQLAAPGTDQSCWGKIGVSKLNHNENKGEPTMELGPRYTWNGCQQRNLSRSQYNVTCEGVKRFKAPIKLSIAAASCWSPRGIALHYRFELTNFKEGTCASASWTSPSLFLIVSSCFLIIELSTLWSTERR